MKRLLFTLLVTVAVQAEVPIGKEVASGPISATVALVNYGQMAKWGMPVPPQYADKIGVTVWVKTSDPDTAKYSISMTIRVGGAVYKKDVAVDRFTGGVLSSAWFDFPFSSDITVLSLTVTEFHRATKTQIGDIEATT